MTRIRWTGDGDREVPFDDDDGARREVLARRMEWVNLPHETALNLNRQDGWELESVKKAQRTRARNEGAAE